MEVKLKARGDVLTFEASRRHSHGDANQARVRGGI